MLRNKIKPNKKIKSNVNIVEKFINLEINIIDNGLGISEHGLK